MLKKLLPEQVQDLLSEESVGAIEQALTDKIQLTVESALTEQDELYSKKLEQLLEAVDKDHAGKLSRVMHQVDKANCSKLKKVINKFNRELNESAESFKNTLVETVSNYLDEYLEESVPQKAILEATRNKSAVTVLSNLRKVLAVDSAIMKESVKDALMDGKTQLDLLRSELEQTRNELKVVKESNEKIKSALILEQKASKLPAKQKDYVTRVLKDKSAKFIAENFDYTVRLFDKQEKEQLKMIKEQAFDQRTVKADAPVIQESTKTKQSQTTPVNMYVQELNRIK